MSGYLGSTFVLTLRVVTDCGVTSCEIAAGCMHTPPVRRIAIPTLISTAGPFTLSSRPRMEDSGGICARPVPFRDNSAADAYLTDYEVDVHETGRYRCNLIFLNLASIPGFDLKLRRLSNPLETALPRNSPRCSSSALAQAGRQSPRSF